MCNKKDVLAYRFGGETAEQWLAIFREYRWDLEEEAEALIPPSRKTITVGYGYPEKDSRLSILHSYWRSTAGPISQHRLGADLFYRTAKI